MTEARRYVRKLKSGSYAVYSTVVTCHGEFDTESEAWEWAKARDPR